MKHFISFLSLFFILTFLPTDGFSQSKHGFQARKTFYNFITPRERNTEWQDIYEDFNGHGLELAYSRCLTPKTYFIFPVKLGVAGIPRYAANSRFLGVKQVTVLNLDWLVQHEFFKYDCLINPYVHFGVGSLYNFKNDHLDFNVPLGLGVKLRLLDNLFFTAQTQYRPSTRKQDSWQHGLGLNFYFGPEKPADRDKDGTPDVSDRCPDDFGPAALAGCPDRDGDNVADIDDKCPDTPGLPTLAGCPDRDEDGITDGEDDCPTEKGLAAFKGCPDTDSDGIADKNDKCPKEAGPASNNGCPVLDRDGDGINDKDDACPDAKGPASTRGCPDRDGDSVADRDDACPDVKGLPAGRGCPDTDGDGVYDNEDRCVDKPGPASNKGCPEIKQEDKAKLENIIKNVQFETGKATLLSRSYPVLDEVVNLMKQYPEYSLAISGHTDNVGDPGFNKSLSERRAKACFDYLVSKGVDPKRMSHAGYGETQPVADNNTKAGRERNRRVDFSLTVK